MRNSEGGELVESLGARDDARRYYSYTVLSGAPVPERAHASFEVEPREAGSRVVWRVEAEPIDPSVNIQARLHPPKPGPAAHEGDSRGRRPRLGTP